jgi:hypothetical protein
MGDWMPFFVEIAAPYLRSFKVRILALKPAAVTYILVLSLSRLDLVKYL